MMIGKGLSGMNPRVIISILEPVRSWIMWEVQEAFVVADAWALQDDVLHEWGYYLSRYFIFSQGKPEDCEYYLE